MQGWGGTIQEPMIMACTWWYVGASLRVVGSAGKRGVLFAASLGLCRMVPLLGLCVGSECLLLGSEACGTSMATHQHAFAESTTRCNASPP